MKFHLAHCLRQCACQFLASYEIKGVGDVLGEQILFASNPCTGKVCTVEMHHQRVDQACPGVNADPNIKGLDRNNMPRPGKVIVCTQVHNVAATPKSSTRRSRCWTSPMTCVAATQRAEFQASECTISVLTRQAQVTTCTAQHHGRT